MDAKVIMDRETGRPRGFGFVTMGSASDADAAVDKLNEYELQGRNIRVSKSNPRAERGAPRGGGGYGGGGGGYGGGGGGYGGGGGGGGGGIIHVLVVTYY